MTRLRLVIVVVLVVGTLARLCYVLSLPAERLDYDEYDYVQAASGLVDEGSFERTIHFHVPPVVPVLYAGAFLFAEPSYVTARVLQCFLFLPIGLVLMMLGTEVGGRLAGVLTLACAALYPYFIFFTGYAMTETTATLVIAAMILLAVRAVKTGATRDAVFFGLVLAAATLTRAAVLYYVLAVPLIYSIGWGWRKWRRWLVASAVTLAAFMVPFAPWMLVNRHYFGELMPTVTTGSGIMLYQTALRITMPDDEERRAFVKQEILPVHYTPVDGTYPQLLESDRFLQKEAAKIIRDNPGAYARIVAANLKRFWQLYPKQSDDARRAALYRVVGLASFGVLLPFFVLGLVIRRDRFGELSAAYGFLLYYTLVHGLVYGMLRYRVPMDGLFLAFAAAGVVAVLGRRFPSVATRLSGVLGTRFGEE